MGILSINLNNIILNDTNYDEDHEDEKLLFIPGFWFGILNLKNRKHLKKT